MPKEQSLRTAILMCGAALTMNLVGAAAVSVLDLPLYLDTSGTVFIAALGGYVPGIAVGFFTNLCKSFVAPSEMYFCSVSVAIAIMTTFLARRGAFQHFAGAVLMIPALTFVTGTCDVLIDALLKMTDILEPVETFDLNFAENFAYELIDKSTSVWITLILLKFVSPQTKRFFRHIGQRQAPLSDDMKHISDERNYLELSLRTKMTVILTLSSLLLSFSISLISFFLFKTASLDDRIKTVDGIVAVVVNEINPYRVDKYIEFGRALRDYRTIQDKLYAIKNSNSNIKYLYVYKFTDEGCKVVFDLDTANLLGDRPGDIVQPEKAVLPYLDDLRIGRPIPPIITDDEFGYLLTLYKPVYDSAGKCTCYAAVDFSMDILNEYNRTFVIKLIALFAGCFVFILAIGLGFIENNIILPVNTMAYCARHFPYESEELREKHFQQLKGLKIRTGDEVENLYAALLRTTENILRYLEHLRLARIQMARMDALAHKDSLTGIQNKAAYDEATAALDGKILTLRAKFCIVMVDVNYLKRINDTYGHECGNEYLINACRLVCAVFGVENVYRVGGDEFVVILEGDKSALVKYFVAQFNLEMARKFSNDNLKPWEKVSAAVGMAHYDPIRDKSAEEVFKRADADMYKNKLAMKAARTD